MEDYVIYIAGAVVTCVVAFLIIDGHNRRMRKLKFPPMRGRGMADALATQQQFDEYQQSALKHIRNHSLHDEKPQYKFTHSEDGTLRFESDEWPEVIGD